MENITASTLSIVSAILAIYFHEAAYSGLAIIIGVFGIIKGDKLGKILSIASVVLGIIGLILFNPFKSPLQTANGNIYSNSTYNFKITPPIGWKINENTKNSIVAFINLDTPKSDHPAIIIQLTPNNNLNLDDYIDSSIMQEESVPGFSLIKKEKFGNDISGFYLLETKLPYPDGGLIHTMELIKQLNNGKAFLVTGASDDSVWNKYSTTIKNSLLSFTY